MDAKGFSRWLARHNLSPKQATEYLDVHRKSIGRFLAGDLEISQRTATACRALDPLRVYRLTPIDAEHIDWRASSHKGPAIVRAQSETLARWHAAKRFHVRTRRRADEGESPVNPWTNSERVRIERLDMSVNIQDGGQPGVIDPAEV